MSIIGVTPTLIDHAGSAKYGCEAKFANVKIELLTFCCVRRTECKLLCEFVSLFLFSKAGKVGKDVRSLRPERFSMFDLATWEKRAIAIKPSAQLFIDGKYVDAASGKTFESISPRDQRVIANISAGDVEDIDRAVASGTKAFEAGAWREMNPRDKKAVMLKWADLIRQHHEELALLEIGRAHV